MVNRIIFQGNLVHDPDVHYSRDKMAIVNITVANTRKYKKKEETAFVDCTVFGKTAETIVKYFTKGKPIIVEGRLALNNWEDNDGNKRSKVYIVVDGFHFAGGGKDDNKSSRGNNRNDNRSSRRSGRDNEESRPNQREEKSDDYDDDILF